MRATLFGTAAAFMLAIPLPAAAQMAGHEGHASHQHTMTVPEGATNGPSSNGPPPPPTDHAADRYYDAGTMARARKLLRYENGGMPVSKFTLDRLEYKTRKGHDGYAWEGDGWLGGDIDRLAVKTEGEGTIGGPLEQAELQGRWSHALDPWFNLALGVRHDIRPRPQRTYAVLAIDGLAPYWFDVEAELFLSEKGDVSARFEGSYDQRITQRLILQPRVGLNFAAQDVPELHEGAGLSDMELGLRLRYEIIPEFAPYVGMEWERKFGDGAAFARAAGNHVSSVSLMTGICVWF